MKWIYVFLLLGFTTLFAQDNEQLAAELDAFILQQMQSQPFPGVAACIVKQGQVVWQGTYGLANIEENSLVDENTLFIVASISKLFVATACIKLVEDGLLDLDADINDYLPIEVVNPNFPNTPITTRQLLLHKSSLHDYESDLQLWDDIGDPIFDLPTFCAEYFVAGGDLYNASNWGATSPDQSAYWYSNAGFTLLGYIVEEASGMPFNDYCQQHVMQPLGMDDSAWFYENLNIEQQAMPYSGGIGSFSPYGYYSVPEYPAAMLRSNISELANFLIVYTQHGQFGDIELFNQSTFEMLVPESMTNGLAWWGMDTWYGDSNGNFWSHGGYMNGVRTQLNYYPDDSTGLVILTNGQGNYNAIQNKLEEYIPLFTVEEEELVANANTILNPNLFEVLDAKNHFSISAFKPCKLTIYNTNGAMVVERDVLSPSFVNVDKQAWAKGMYIIEARHLKEEQVQHHKIFVD